MHDVFGKLRGIMSRLSAARSPAPVIAGSHRALRTLALTAGLALSPPSDGLAQAIDTNLWVTNGQVECVAAAGGKIYIGGNFTQVGPATGGGVPLDISAGSPLSSFPRVIGVVHAAVSDGAGGWYIGGDFTAVGGLPRNNIARVNSDMSVAAWDPNCYYGGVRALAVSGTTVYVGGDFSNIGGQPRNFIAALDAITGAATAWNPGADNLVTALAVSSTNVYAGGYFTSIGGQPRVYIAALDETTGAATAWNPDPNERVWALAVSGSTVYAGGYFTAIGGQVRNHIAALDSLGAATAWNPDANSHVRALAVSGSTVFAGGVFTAIGEQVRNRIAAIDATTGAVTDWDPNASSEVYALAVSGSTVYLGGAFASVAGQTRSRVAALDTSGAATPWNPNADKEVYALALSGSAIYAGGEFRSIGGQARNYIAALDSATGAATSWNPSASERVFALAVSGSVVYAGGVFGSIGGQGRARLAALDAATGAATSWNPAPDNNVFALAVSGPTVYAGGAFANIGGQNRRYLAAFDATTGAVTGFQADPNVGGYIRSLAASGSTVYAGGDFTAMSGQPRNHIAAVDAVTGVVSDWNPDANDKVFAIATDGTIVHVGGAFTMIGGGAHYYGAAIDPNTGIPTGWNPYFSGNVTTLAIVGCTVYAGGDFVTNNRYTRDQVAAFDAVTGTMRPWSPGGMNERVRALAVSGSKVYVGGYFTVIGGLPQATIAAISIAPSVAAIYPASGGNDGAVTVTISGENLVNCTTVRLARSGEPDIQGGGIVASMDELSLATTFDLRGAASGTWDVVIENAGTGPATLPNGFTVEAVAAPQLRVDVVGPDSIRASHPTAFDLVIGNPGNVDAQAVPLWITGIPTDASVTLDFPLATPPQEGGEPDWSQVPDTLTSAAGCYLALVLPRIPPGSVTRRIFLTVPSSNPSFQLRAALTPPWADGAAFRTCLSDNGVITDAACMGTQLTVSNAYLANTTGIAALNGIALWARIGWQCEGAGTLPAAIAEARQALDFMVQPVEQPGAAPGSCDGALRPRWRDSLAVMVVGSIDPNEKVGKRGTLSSRQTIPYAIHFENDSTATAYAQRVTVSDVLPATVDVNTVSLVAITFGDTQLHPLPGLSHGSWDVDLGPSRNVVVRVEAGFTPPAVLTRQLVWSFTSLNRTTLEPLDPGSFNGFLPPNHAPPEGEGSVVFTVMPFEGLSTGTEIQNHGMITFDYNAPQATEVWKNTVDNTPPASRVLPLSAKQDSATFTVSWEAIGAPPDLKDFTIYASEDAGAYRVWRLNTVASADTFAGRRGRSYAFYCQARDTIGNIEPAHASPDAETLPLVAVGEASPLRLALAGAWPNPAFGVIQALFTLPSREPATLDLIDVAGRRVQRREVGALGPGPHMVVLAPQRLRPGLYFLRLAQGGRALTARVVVIR